MTEPNSPTQSDNADRALTEMKIRDYRAIQEQKAALQIQEREVENALSDLLLRRSGRGKKAVRHYNQVANFLKVINGISDWNTEEDIAGALGYKQDRQGMTCALLCALKLIAEARVHPMSNQQFSRLSRVSSLVQNSIKQNVSAVSAGFFQCMLANLSKLPTVLIAYMEEQRGGKMAFREYPRKLFGALRRLGLTPSTLTWLPSPGAFNVLKQSSNAVPLGGPGPQTSTMVLGDLNLHLERKGLDPVVCTVGIEYPHPLPPDADVMSALIVPSSEIMKVPKTVNKKVITSQGEVDQVLMTTHSLFDEDEFTTPDFIPKHSIDSLDVRACSCLLEVELLNNGVNAKLDEQGWPTETFFELRKEVLQLGSTHFIGNGDVCSMSFRFAAVAKNIDFARRNNIIDPEVVLLKLAKYYAVNCMKVPSGPNNLVQLALKLMPSELCAAIVEQAELTEEQAAGFPPEFVEKREGKWYVMKENFEMSSFNMKSGAGIPYGTATKDLCIKDAMITNDEMMELIISMKGKFNEQLYFHKHPYIEFVQIKPKKEVYAYTQEFPVDQQGGATPEQVEALVEQWKRANLLLTKTRAIYNPCFAAVMFSILFFSHLGKTSPNIFEQAESGNYTAWMQRVRSLKNLNMCHGNVDLLLRAVNTLPPFEACPSSGALTYSDNCYFYGYLPPEYSSLEHIAALCEKHGCPPPDTTANEFSTIRGFRVFISFDASKAETAVSVEESDMHLRYLLELMGLKETDNWYQLLYWNTKRTCAGGIGFLNGTAFRLPFNCSGNVLTFNNNDLKSYLGACEYFEDLRIKFDEDCHYIDPEMVIESVKKCGLVWTLERVVIIPDIKIHPLEFMDEDAVCGLDLLGCGACKRPSKNKYDEVQYMAVPCIERHRMLQSLSFLKAVTTSEHFKDVVRASKAFALLLCGAYAFPPVKRWCELLLIRCPDFYKYTVNELEDVEASAVRSCSLTWMQEFSALLKKCKVEATQESATLEMRLMLAHKVVEIFGYPAYSFHQAFGIEHEGRVNSWVGGLSGEALMPGAEMEIVERLYHSLQRHLTKKDEKDFVWTEQLLINNLSNLLSIRPSNLNFHRHINTVRTDDSVFKAEVDRLRKLFGVSKKFMREVLERVANREPMTTLYGRAQQEKLEQQRARDRELRRAAKAMPKAMLAPLTRAHPIPEEAQPIVTRRDGTIEVRVPSATTHLRTTKHSTIKKELGKKAVKLESGYTLRAVNTYEHQTLQVKGADPLSNYPPVDEADVGSVPLSSVADASLQLAWSYLAGLASKVGTSADSIAVLYGDKSTNEVRVFTKIEPSPVFVSVEDGRVFLHCPPYRNELSDFYGPPKTVVMSRPNVWPALVSTCRGLSQPDSGPLSALLSLCYLHTALNRGSALVPSANVATMALAIGKSEKPVDFTPLAIVIPDVLTIPTDPPPASPPTIVVAHPEPSMKAPDEGLGELPKYDEALDGPWVETPWAEYTKPVPPGSTGWSKDDKEVVLRVMNWDPIKEDLLKKSVVKREQDWGLQKFYETHFYKFAKGPTGQHIPAKRDRRQELELILEQYPSLPPGDFLSLKSIVQPTRPSDPTMAKFFGYEKVHRESLTVKKAKHRVSDDSAPAPRAKAKPKFNNKMKIVERQAEKAKDNKRK